MNICSAKCMSTCISIFFLSTTSIRVIWIFCCSKFSARLPRQTMDFQVYSKIHIIHANWLHWQGYDDRCHIKIEIRIQKVFQTKNRNGLNVSRLKQFSINHTQHCIIMWFSRRFSAFWNGISTYVHNHNNCGRHAYICYGLKLWIQIYANLFRCLFDYYWSMLMTADEVNESRVLYILRWSIVQIAFQRCRCNDSSCDFIWNSLRFAVW